MGEGKSPGFHSFVRDYSQSWLTYSESELDAIRNAEVKLGTRVRFTEESKEINVPLGEEFPIVGVSSDGKLKILCTSTDTALIEVSPFHKGLEIKGRARRYQ